MRSRTDANPAAWQELVIQALRMTARISLRLHSIPLAGLKGLLGVALYRELQARGHSLAAMSLLLDCSPGTVKNLGRLSRRLERPTPSEGALHRLLKQAKRRPLRAVDLELLLPRREGFDAGRVAVDLLVHRGILEPVPAEAHPAWRLSEAYASLAGPDWDAPLAETERLLQVAIRVVEALTRGPATLDALEATPELRRLPRDQLEDALAFLQQQGYLAPDPDETARLRLSDGNQRMIPPEASSRIRIGLLHLLEKLGWSLEFMIDGQHPERFGQRTWLFEARPEDLQAFIRAHRDYVAAQIDGLEARARAEGGGQRCVMVWAVSPVPGHER